MKAAIKTGPSERRIRRNEIFIDSTPFLEQLVLWPMLRLIDCFFCNFVAYDHW